MKHFDLIVIGSGPAGQRAAIQAAKVGKKVVVVERLPATGGLCVHRGTLPSKSFRESVYRWSLGSRGLLGQEAEPSREVRRVAELPDMGRLLRRKERVVKGESHVTFDQLTRNDVTVLHGHARFRSAMEVEIAAHGKTPASVISAPKIIIAVGARPVAPAHLHVDGKLVHDSDTILSLRELPKSLVVLGAGIIGCEYASMFAMAGTHVHLIDRRDSIISWADREIVEHLVERFDDQGMKTLLQVEATKIEEKKRPDQRKRLAVVHLNDGRRIQTEAVLIAMGRAGNTEDLALEKAGVKLGERGLIPVNENYQTSVPHIYAVGDVVGPPALASTSLEQGRMACAHAFGLENPRMGQYFPYGIYTIPEISMVGKTAEELNSEHVEFVTGRARYAELARGQIVGDRWGFLKMLVDRKTLKILGVHIIGDNAADLVHIGQAVMALDGDVNYFIQSVFNYPTLAEAYKTAAFHAMNQIRGARITPASNNSIRSQH